MAELQDLRNETIRGYCYRNPLLFGCNECYYLFKNKVVFGGLLFSKNKFFLERSHSTLGSSSKLNLWV